MMLFLSMNIKTTMWGISRGKLTTILVRRNWRIISRLPSVYFLSNPQGDSWKSEILVQDDNPLLKLMRTPGPEPRRLFASASEASPLYRPARR
jgi:hypothetical protein